MADVIADSLEGELRFYQFLDTGMTERVCAWPAHLNPCLAKVRCHGGGNSAVGDGRLRSQNTKEYVPILRFRPSGAQILDKGFGHYISERVSRRMPGFAFGNLQSLSFPVNIVEGQFGYLMRTQTIRHQEKKHGIVPSPSNRPPVNGFEQAAHFLPNDRPRHIG